MRKKYKQALLSHKKRIELLEASLGAARMTEKEYSDYAWGCGKKKTVGNRLGAIEIRHEREDAEQAVQQDIASLTIKQRKRYHEARKPYTTPDGKQGRPGYDHGQALLIAKECCAS